MMRKPKTKKDARAVLARKGELEAAAMEELFAAAMAYERDDRAEERLLDAARRYTNTMHARSRAQKHLDELSKGGAA